MISGKVNKILSTFMLLSFFVIAGANDASASAECMDLSCVEQPLRAVGKGILTVLNSHIVSCEPSDEVGDSSGQAETVLFSYFPMCRAR